VGSITLHANENRLLLPENVLWFRGKEKTVWFRTTKEYNKDWIKFAFRCTLVLYSKEEASLGQNSLKIHFGFKTLFLEQKMTKALLQGQFDISSRTHSKIKLLKKEPSVTDRALFILNRHLVSGANGFYPWSTGETTDSIEVSKEGDTTVVVTNDAGCSETRTRHHLSC
jgi:hypothetical protein